MKNPFEILGITPEICRKLADEELYGLVKSAYRALQTVYHPDRGGHHKKSIEMNLAFEMLDWRKHQDDFIKYKERYVKRLYKRKKERVQELEEQLEQQKQLYRKAARSHYECILDRVYCEERRNSIASLQSVMIGLYDVALQQNLPHALNTYGTNYKKIRVDEQGVCFVKEVGSAVFHERKFTKFLGTIPRQDVEILPHLQGYETTPHVPFNLRNEKKLLGYKKPLFKNIILEENFTTYCLPHLVPIIKENNYLISLNTRTKSLILDGVIIKITHVSEISS
jgi:hypothetical protein